MGVPLPPEDLTGRRFGRWKVTGYAHVRDRMHYYACICRCGNRGTVRGTELRAGVNTGCPTCARSGVLKTCVVCNRAFRGALAAKLCGRAACRAARVAEYRARRKEKLS